MKRSILAASAAVLLAVCPTFAQTPSSTRILNAYENSEVTTTFNLNFPDLGISSTSNVFYTRMQLEVDDVLGTATLTQYDQEIDSLSLPLGIQTGPITVNIVSSEGTYNKASNTFTTNDVYSIKFTNDLSAFGFESPVILPSTSNGRIVNTSTTQQNILMDWQGSGEFDNSENPSEPYKYTYTCNMNTRIARSAAEIPPIPTRTCATGALSLFGFFGFTATFVGMKRRVRRSRRS